MKFLSSTATLAATVIGVLSSVGFRESVAGSIETRTVGANADKVKSLLYVDTFPSDQFSGFLDVEGTGIHLHYWLIESQNDPENDPLVLWLNGGPGCSSIDGLLYEHGPFRFTDGGKGFEPFEWTWTKNANVLYIESPVGVGFSYSDNPEDYALNDDDNTAQNNLKALESFLTKFPEHGGDKQFFITGESYAGIYVPTLAEAIVTSKDTTVNVPTAIAVGNGCTGTEIGVCGGQRDRWMSKFFAKSTGFVSEDVRTLLEMNCDWDDPDSPLGSKCMDAIDQMEESLGNINMYNVMGECLGESDNVFSKTEGVNYKVPVGNNANQKGPVACIDSIEASAYMNNKDVMNSLHLQDPGYEWATCGSQPTFQYNSTRPNLPRDTYPLLVQNMRVVIYNGDWDACVPYTDNQAWTSDFASDMKLDTADAWHPWTYSYNPGYGDDTHQVGGYATSYKLPSSKAKDGKSEGDAPAEFTFITIRGGRHEVPESAPQRAFEMLRRVLQNEDF